MDSISIELDTPLITQGCASRIVRTIVELLLYNRTQIPFPYTTFRAMVKKLESAEPTDATHSVAELRIQKQREKAQHVVQCVEMLFDTIEKILSNHPPIGELMIVFGKTIYTAKEAFIITLPAIDRNHIGENHQRSLEKVLRKIGLQLTLCDQLISGQAVTSDTNIFVMVQSSCTLHPTLGVNLLDNFQLPKKCVKYEINFKMTNNGGDETVNGCCKRLEIYSEEESMVQSGTLPTAAQATTTEFQGPLSNEWFLLDAVISGFSIKSPKENVMWK
uniref:MAD2L1-binding protein n=1 Tax=Anopheles coluzzii TaxID=1518534 RepID=A0A8W7Q552_ANOCL